VVTVMSVPGLSLFKKVQKYKQSGENNHWHKLHDGDLSLVYCSSEMLSDQ
jgi:hypothetical protein